MPSVAHCTDRYANNRAEVSHQPTRQRERQMRRYRSFSSANRKHADILEFWLHPRNPGEMVEEPQGQGSLDGEIRVAPLPTPPAAPAGRPGRDRFRGQPHRHIAAANEGLIVGRPVRNAVLRLIRGIDLQLHPCSVAPAEGPEKCGSRRPTRSGYSCNNAPARSRGPGERRRPDTARLAEWCDAAIAFWEELSVKLITRYYPFGGRNAPGSRRRVYRHETVPRAAGRPAPDLRPLSLIKSSYLSRLPSMLSTTAPMMLMVSSSRRLCRPANSCT